MPDWSYHGIFKPILSMLPPAAAREFIHRGMSAIASLPFGLGSHIINFLGREECSPLLNKNLNDISFSNPVGLSGKIDPLLSGTRAFANLGFGFLEIGPVTAEPRLHGGSPVIHKDSNRILFSDVPKSIGLEHTKNKLTKLTKKQPLFIRLSGRQNELFAMIEKLDSFADGFILETHEPKSFTNTSKPIFLSINSLAIYHLSISELESYSGVILEEQTGVQELLDAVHYLKSEGYKKTIITAGGIAEPEQALQLLDAGADLIMLSDGYVFSGPGLTKRINEALLARIAHHALPQHGWFAYWLFGLFIFIGGLLALIFSITSIILPYDEHFLGMNKEQIWFFNERIMLFMAHDRMTLAER